MEKLGLKECKSGSKVLEKSKCESACKELNVERDESAVLEDGQSCFSTQEQKCRMQTNLPTRAPFRLICKRSGERQYC